MDSQWKLLWHNVNYNNIGLTLKLELASGVAEKVIDVYLYATEINFCAQEKDGSERDVTVPCHEQLLVKLTKQSGYEHTFSTNQVSFSIYNSLNVSVTVKLVMLKCSLSIINDVKVPPLALENKLRRLLTFEIEEKGNKFTDVKISITGTDESSPVTFFAHKAILAVTSPVFAKMFEHDLQESATSCVTLSDIDPEVFKELLTYIYTDKAPQIQTMASSLLNAAEKYQLDRLKAMCEQQLSYGLQVDNAAETLVLAHTYGAVQLKKNALMYIIKYRNEVRETQDWEKVHNKCELLEELLDTALELAANKKL